MKSFSTRECEELKNIMRKFGKECAQNNEHIEAVEAELKKVNSQIDDGIARLKELSRARGQTLKKVDLAVACKAIANFKI